MMSSMYSPHLEATVDRSLTGVSPTNFEPIWDDKPSLKQPEAYSTTDLPVFTGYTMYPTNQLARGGYTFIPSPNFQWIGFSTSYGAAVLASGNTDPISIYNVLLDNLTWGLISPQEALSGMLIHIRNTFPHSGVAEFIKTARDQHEYA